MAMGQRVATTVHCSVFSDSRCRNVSTTMYVLHPVVAVLQRKKVRHVESTLPSTFGTSTLYSVDVAPSRVLSPELPILVQPTCFCSVSSNRLRVVNRSEPESHCPVQLNQSSLAPHPDPAQLAPQTVVDATLHSDD